MSDPLQDLERRLGPSRPGPAIAEERIATYAPMLPDTLIEWWRGLGAGSIGDGLLWLVDPEEWGDIRAELFSFLDLDGFPKDLAPIPVLRTAYGRVYFWSTRYGPVLSIDPQRGTFGGRPPAGPMSMDPDRMFRFWMSGFTTDVLDLADPDGDRLLPAAIERHGQLRDGQAYAIVPYPMMGGVATVDTLDPSEIKVMISICAQMRRQLL